MHVPLEIPTTKYNTRPNIFLSNQTCFFFWSNQTCLFFFLVKKLVCLNDPFICSNHVGWAWKCGPVTHTSSSRGEGCGCRLEKFVEGLGSVMRNFTVWKLLFSLFWVWIGECNSSRLFIGIGLLFSYFMLFFLLNSSF